jgi:flagellar biosynthesis protein FlhB
MAEDTDKSQKTEEPTPKKLEDARKKGDMARSQDVAAWFTLVAATALLAGAGPLAAGVATPLRGFIVEPHAFSTDGEALRLLLAKLLMGLAPAVLTALAILWVSALAGNLVQNMPIWTVEKMKPKLDKISPIAGFKRIFGAEGWMTLLKSVLKLIGVGAAVMIAVWPMRSTLAQLGGLDLVSLFAALQMAASRLMLAALIAIALIAALDYFWQKHSHNERMKMSLQEVRDEFKQTEGDPHVRARLRQIRAERSRKRMLANVPKATVIVTNPTHYAVALRYEQGETPAPICVAKGVDAVALRIRAAGAEHDVPIIENPPLARALYASAEIDQPVPREHFEAVAKVIGYVLGLSQARAGSRRPPPFRPGGD